jgi:hypothetical protein
MTFLRETSAAGLKRLNARFPLALNYETRSLTHSKTISRLRRLDYGTKPFVSIHTLGNLSVSLRAFSGPHLQCCCPKISGG